MKQSNPTSHRRIVYNIPGHAHLLTFSCYHREALLSEDCFCYMLAESLAASLTKQSYDLWGYVFMPDHVHLVVWPREENYRISSFLQRVKLSSSKKLIKHFKTTCPEELKRLETSQTSHSYRVWQSGGGHDRNLFSLKAVKWARNYIHENP